VKPLSKAPQSKEHGRYGIHYGIVTQNQDPEKLERVKVKFPWLNDTDESHWCTLATPMEGKEFGWYALPDIGDVVTVMFQAGAMSQPIVFGGIWSKADNSPEPNEDGKNNFRGYRSRSGHRLILDDTAKTKIVFMDKDGKNSLGMGEFEEDGAGPNKSAVFIPPMAGTNGVSFSSMEGKLNIWCPKGTLTLKAEQNIKVHAKTTLDVKAGSELKMEGGSNAKVTASAPVAYDASTIQIN
jgi:uncharacterized protein involved in type VI secretion and phage assembly